MRQHVREYHDVVDREGRILHDGTEIVDARTLGFFLRAMTRTEDGQLFCRVRRGAFRARFGGIAMQQIAPFLAADDGGLALAVGDARYPIPELAPAAC